MKKIFTFTVAALTVAAVSAWAFVNQIVLTTPTIGTNASTSVSSPMAGRIHRVIFALSGNAGATGEVQLIDFDQTVLVDTQLVTGSSITITGSFVVYQPSLILTNATSTNVSATAAITYWQ